MTALLIILLVLTLILLVPLGIDGGYSQGKLVVGAKAGPFNFQIVPAKKRKKKTKKPPKRRRQRDEGEPKHKKEKKSLSKKQLLGLIKLGLKAIGRFRKRLSIDYLRIHVIYATDDPFDTAVNFGIANAAVGILLPLLDNALDIKEPDFHLGCSFTQNETSIDIWLTTTIRVGQILFIALAFGIEFLSKKIKEKRKIRNIERNEGNGQTPDR